MSRRRRTRAAFSLFSFQDIITSVTAILILLVLILSLELVTRRQEAAAADPMATRVALQESVASLQSLVGTLAAIVPADKPRALVARTRSELARDTRIVESQADQAIADAEAARAVEGRARAMAAATVARLRDAERNFAAVDRIKMEALRVDEEARKLAIRNKARSAELSERRERITDRPSPGAELVFNPPEGTSTQAWIIEVSGDGFTVVRLGTNQRQSLGSGVGPGSAAGQWLSRLNERRDHVLILVRPSGANSMEVIRQSLGEAGISFGIDLIGEEQVVRDGAGEAKEQTGGAAL